MTIYFVVFEYSGLENGVVTVISILKFIRCHLARQMRGATPCRGAVRRGALHRMALLLLRRRASHGACCCCAAAAPFQLPASGGSQSATWVWRPISC